LGAGRGGVPTFHVAGYYVGNLFIPGYNLVWEKELASHPSRLAMPLEIIIKASNGASDNANCFGNPVTMGVFRSFEIMVGPDHYGWKKCAMIAGSGGYLDAGHITKHDPQKGMLVVQTGGPAFRIGLGGGSGSSRDAGDSKEDLDFNSVQRADPVMEQCNMNVFRACSELGEKNPICNDTDLGAGGYCVAFGEVVFPSGARVEIRRLPCGDKTMPVYVFWCNEAQERMAVLIWPEEWENFQAICQRNRCPVYVCGEITGDGQFVLTDEAAAAELGVKQGKPIDLSMDFMLADLPQITVTDQTVVPQLKPLSLPEKSLDEWLKLVLRVPDVGSKEFLTRKADRSVGGRIAQQQTVGPLQTTLADNMVIATSLFQTDGHALAIGEQPIKGLINTEAGVRMSLTESLLNLVWAKINGLKSVSLSATWQWPCGQPGEDAKLYRANKALAILCRQLGIRIAVGKDSVSMTAKTVKDGQPHAIKAPGTVQLMSFAYCPDLTKKVTPDLKAPGRSKLLYLDLSGGYQRLGGSALARVAGQLGDESPDFAGEVERGFCAIQELIGRDLILAGHDRSDGGLITCLLEMAFAGNCGLMLNFFDRYLNCHDLLKFLFNEEAGVVIEYLPENYEVIRGILRRHGLVGFYHSIGQTMKDKIVSLRHNNDQVLYGYTYDFRESWRETSFQLDALQANPEVVKEERENTLVRNNPRYETLISGWERACNLARCVYSGGETPTLKGIIYPQTILLSGSAVGIIKPKDQLITSANIRPGDVIILLLSSGIHANGLTMARRIAELLPQGYLTQLNLHGETYGQALLRPTHIYAPVIEDCQQAGVNIHYAVNITGHGWRKLMRAQENFVYVIENIPTPQPVFALMQKYGGYDDAEAYGNYNQGAGFALYVAPNDADKVLAAAKQNKIEAMVAGHIEKRGPKGQEKKVIIEPKNLVFEANSMKLRSKF
jgi:phosphoribosylformylglycinamidine synthase